MERRYFDSGVFLTPLLKNQPTATIRRCQDWLDRVARGEVEGVTSWLTWDEVTWCVGKARGLPFDYAAACEAGAAFRSLAHLRFVPAGPAEIAEAERLLGAYQLHPRDAIHASTALLHAGGQIVTLDSDFRQRDPAAAGLTVTEID